MFENVGTKLKVLAYITVILGFLGSIGGGIALMSQSFFLGIVVILGGFLASWLTALPIYGIGEAADNSWRATPSSAPRGSLIKKAPEMPKAPLTVRDIKRCPHCGDTVRSKICDMCGQANDLFN